MYGGQHCDQCARGYTGTFPDCRPCGECFQNWDRILSELKAKTEELVEEARNIEHKGVEGFQDENFKVRAELFVAGAKG